MNHIKIGHNTIVFHETKYIAGYDIGFTDYINFHDKVKYEIQRRLETIKDNNYIAVISQELDDIKMINREIFNRYESILDITVRLEEALAIKSDTRVRNKI